MNRRDLERFSQSIVDIYNEIENEMLINIARLLKSNKSLLEEDPTKWQLQRLEQLGMLEKNNIKVIRDKAGLTSREINRVLLAAGLEGVKQNEELLKKALKKGARLVQPVPVSESPTILAILEAYQNQAKGTLNLTNQTLVDKSKQSYIQILNETHGKMLVGNITGDKAIRSTISQWAEKGIPALIDRSGREWGAEGYVRMVMMTTSNNVVNEMQDARLEEWGNDLVEISSHDGNRPGCQPYAGRIFSLKPNHPRYPYLYDPGIGRIGDPDSLFGINCGHIKFPFIEGISTQRFKPNSREEDNRIYEESQKQRAIERSIRKAKTRVKMLEAVGDMEGVEQAKQLVKNRQAVMRSFIKDTGRTRRYNREQIFS